MNKCVIQVKKLCFRARVPQPKSDLAAGMDLSALLEEDETVVLEPGQIKLIPTGIAVSIAEGYEGQVRPRSGLACKHGVTVVNAPGTIDADYRGEIRVGLINLGSEPFELTSAMRIAQLVIAPVASAQVAVVDELDETIRGADGFGSTGLK